MSTRLTSIEDICPNCAAMRQQLIETWLEDVQEPLDCEPLDPNNYRERAALMEAKRIGEMEPLPRQRAIADLILTNLIQDVNRAAFHARLAAINGGGN